MKAIVNTAANRLEFIEWEKPVAKAGQVLIRSTAVAICATDLQMIAGWERTGFPSIPGHEWTGVVDAVGPGGDTMLIGRRCVADNVLSDGGEVGFEHPGAYGEYFITEQANIRVLPEMADAASAALIEPLAVCVRGWNRIDRHATGPTLVIGDGPIGQLMLLLLRHHGVADLTMIGGRPARLALARELGAAQVLNYHQIAGNLAEGVRRACGKQFATVVEASGAASGMELALRSTIRGGRVLVLGDYAGNCAAFPWNDLLHHEWSLIGSCASAGGWDEAVKLAGSAAIPLWRLVTHRLPASQFAQGIELTRQNRDNMIKVVLEWPR